MQPHPKDGAAPATIFSKKRLRCPAKRNPDSQVRLLSTPLTDRSGLRVDRRTGKIIFPESQTEFSAASFLSTLGHCAIWRDRQSASLMAPIIAGLERPKTFQYIIRKPSWKAIIVIHAAGVLQCNWSSNVLTLGEQLHIQHAPCFRRISDYWMRLVSKPSRYIMYLLAKIGMEDPSHLVTIFAGGIRQLRRQCPKFLQKLSLGIAFPKRPWKKPSGYTRHRGHAWRPCKNRYHSAKEPTQSEDSEDDDDDEPVTDSQLDEMAHSIFGMSLSRMDEIVTRSVRSRL